MEVVGGFPKRSNLSATMCMAAPTPSPVPVIRYVYNPGNARACNPRHNSTSDSEDEDSHWGDDTMSGMKGILRITQDTKMEHPDEADYCAEEAACSPAGRVLGRKASYAYANSADVLVEEIIRKTRRTGLHSTVRGSPAPYGAARGGLGDVAVPCTPGAPHPLTDARHGLLLLTGPQPPPLQQTPAGGGWVRGHTHAEPAPRSPDYIGDSAGNIFPALSPSPVNAGAGFGFGLANTPTHQEFFALEDAPKEALESGDSCVMTVVQDDCPD